MTTIKISRIFLFLVLSTLASSQEPLEPSSHSNLGHAGINCNGKIAVCVGPLMYKDCISDGQGVTYANGSAKRCPTNSRCVNDGVEICVPLKTSTDAPAVEFISSTTSRVAALSATTEGSISTSTSNVASSTDSLQPPVKTNPTEIQKTTDTLIEYTASIVQTTYAPLETTNVSVDDVLNVEVLEQNTLEYELPLQTTIATEETTLVPLVFSLPVETTIAPAVLKEEVYPSNLVESALSIDITTKAGNNDPSLTIISTIGPTDQSEDSSKTWAPTDLVEPTTIAGRNDNEVYSTFVSLVPSEADGLILSANNNDAVDTTIAPVDSTSVSYDSNSDSFRSTTPIEAIAKTTTSTPLDTTVDIILSITDSTPGQANPVLPLDSNNLAETTTEPAASNLEQANYNTDVVPSDNTGLEDQNTTEQINLVPTDPSVVDNFPVEILTDSSLNTDSISVFTILPEIGSNAELTTGATVQQNTPFVGDALENANNPLENTATAPKDPNPNPNVTAEANALAQNSILEEPSTISYPNIPVGSNGVTNSSASLDGIPESNVSFPAIVSEEANASAATNAPLSSDTTSGLFHWIGQNDPVGNPTTSIYSSIANSDAGLVNTNIANDLYSTIETKVEPNLVSFSPVPVEANISVTETTPDTLNSNILISSSNAGDSIPSGNLDGLNNSYDPNSLINSNISSTGSNNSEPSKPFVPNNVENLNDPAYHGSAAVQPNVSLNPDLPKNQSALSNSSVPVNLNTTAALDTTGDFNSDTSGNPSTPVGINAHVSNASEDSSASGNSNTPIVPSILHKPNQPIDQSTAANNSNATIVSNTNSLVSSNVPVDENLQLNKPTNFNTAAEPNTPLDQFNPANINAPANTDNAGSISVAPGTNYDLSQNVPHDLSPQSNQASSNEPGNSNTPVRPSPTSNSKDSEQANIPSDSTTVSSSANTASIHQENSNALDISQDNANVPITPSAIVDNTAVNINSVDSSTRPSSFSNATPNGVGSPSTSAGIGYASTVSPVSIAQEDSNIMVDDNTQAQHSASLNPNVSIIPNGVENNNIPTNSNSPVPQTPLVVPNIPVSPNTAEIASPAIGSGLESNTPLAPSIAYGSSTSADSVVPVLPNIPLNPYLSSNSNSLSNTEIGGSLLTSQSSQNNVASGTTYTGESFTSNTADPIEAVSSSVSLNPNLPSSQHVLDNTNAPGYSNISVTSSGGTTSAVGPSSNVPLVPVDPAASNLGNNPNINVPVDLNSSAYSGSSASSRQPGKPNISGGGTSTSTAESSTSNAATAVTLEHAIHPNPSLDPNLSVGLNAVTSPTEPGSSNRPISSIEPNNVHNINGPSIPLGINLEQDTPEAIAAIDFSAHQYPGTTVNSKAPTSPNTLDTSSAPINSNSNEPITSDASVPVHNYIKPVSVTETKEPGKRGTKETENSASERPADEKYASDEHISVEEKSKESKQREHENQSKEEEKKEREKEKREKEEEKKRKEKEKEKKIKEERKKAEKERERDSKNVDESDDESEEQELLKNRQEAEKKLIRKVIKNIKNNRCDDDDDTYPDVKDCKKYYRCVKKSGTIKFVHMRCDDDKRFDFEDQKCVKKSKAHCLLRDE